MEESLETDKIEKIQSYFRRNYVQNEMLKVRKTYEEVFNEIETDESEMCVVWPGSETNDKHLSILAYPKFVSKKDKKQNLKLIKSKEEPKQETKSSSSSNQANDLAGIDLNSEQIEYLDIENLKKMSKTDLISLRESISLEMLWIQQAIQSRIQYLKLKKSIQINRNMSNDFN